MDLQQIQQASRRVLRMRQTSQKTGVCESTIHALIAKKQFPAPFTIVPGGRAVGWLEADVDAWILERKAAGKVA